MSLYQTARLACFVIWLVIAALAVGVFLSRLDPASAYDAKLRYSQVEGATKYRLTATPQGKSWEAIAPEAADVTIDLESIVTGVDGRRAQSFVVVAQNDSGSSPTSNALVISAVDPDNDGLLESADPCPTDPRNACVGPVATDKTGRTLRINAAGDASECAGQKVDCNGDVWLADFGANTGTAATCNLTGGGEGCIIYDIAALFGCGGETTEDLFQCERYDKPVAPELAYTFDVNDGYYLVNLLLAETYTGITADGRRVFDVYAEGDLRYQGLDVYAQAGGAGIAIVRALDVVVDDGNGLTIEFRHGVENPAIKAIEVLKIGDCLINDDCLDGNVCTVDTCEGAVPVCVHRPRNIACEDGLFCTSGDTCADSVCVSGAKSPCPNGTICIEQGQTCEPITTTTTTTTTLPPSSSTTVTTTTAPLPPTTIYTTTTTTTTTTTSTTTSTTTTIPALTCANRWDWDYDGELTVMDALHLLQLTVTGGEESPCRQ